MKAVVFTLGCKVNECESDSIIAELSQKGIDVSDKLQLADVYIINTCAVTKEAEKKSRQAASRVIRLNPNAKIIYTGCACQKCPTDFINKNNVTLVTGTFGKNRISDMLDENGIKLFPETKEFEELTPVKSLRTRTYVKVQDGCDNFCSYCTIPLLRGRNRSRNPENVIKEITSQNPKETVINGLNLSAYDYDGRGLTGLMERLKDVDTRIRLGSLEVRVIDEKFLTALKNLKDFAPHFHLSLQSGSNAVLKKMNRHYTREEYIEKVAMIRSFFPDAGITTDIIAGFPTESDEDFTDTVNLIDVVRFSDIHPFIFSPREGTVAYKMKDVDYTVKKQREDILLKKKEECKNNFALSETGKVSDVLIEEVNGGIYEGYSGNYLRTYVKDTVPIGEIVKVRATVPFKDGVLAEIIK